MLGEPRLDPHGVEVLERIGYQVSEDERKALKGAYLGGGDDES